MSCVALDQDGTLYASRSALTDALRSRTRAWLMRRLALDNEQINALYERLPHTHPNPFHGFASLGLLASDYHAEVFDSLDCERYVEAAPRLREALLSLAQPLYVVTYAARGYSSRLQTALGLDGCFLETLCVVEWSAHRKEECYAHLAARHGGLVAIGDNERLDLQPALNGGWPSLHVTDEYSIFDALAAVAGERVG
ncbi:MAG: hypothetical protein M4D80_40570 [Myxococcota bacterium]|nr:hypothetical protein [Myxococcota bacterium]